MTARRAPDAAAQRPRHEQRIARTSPTRHRSITIIVGDGRSSTASCRSSCRCPAAQSFIQQQQSGSTPSPTPASSSCWRMGLNVVVGLAGLLDLGYAAFFAIGAYTYAYSQLAVHGHRRPVLADAARRRGRRGDLRHPAGRAHAAAARRLPGDRDAGLRRDRADRVPERSTLVHQRHQRHRRHLPPEPLLGHRRRSAALSPFAYYITDGRHRHDRP